jgi:GNAT superfamily N-acetyltransferase
MPLHAGHVGQRVVVRRLLPGESGPSGGPAMTDVLGILESVDDESLRVRRENGDVVLIDRALLVTGKPVPPRASTRLRIGPEQLERICEQGWRAPVEQPLGDWMLRAAGGFTGRTNSARVGRDPGVDADAAVLAVEEFYAEHGLPAMVQAVVGTDWQREFEDRGWVQARPGGQDALVQVASVAQARRVGRDSPTGAPEVVVEDSVSEDWMALYGRAAGIAPTVVRAVMESGDHVAFASIGEPVVAIGRAVVTGDWMGLQAVEVAPEHRRRGLATRIVETLLDWGASYGALSAYLQTVADNTAAARLYEAYGFVTHHTYRYLRPPG